ncbi:MAG: amidohydrolase family protein [Alphaproteobacteria bacterium]
MRRRRFLQLSGGAALAALAPFPARALQPFDFARARPLYLDRIAAFRRDGVLPVLDIESSYNPVDIDLADFTRDMDRAGIAMMCLSADQPGKLVEQGRTWSDHALEAWETYPAYFIPTGNGGNHPAWTRNEAHFLDDNERFIAEHRYPLMGEFEFRHYPSPRQVQRGDMFRDVNIPIDGPSGHRLFAFAARTGIPFQIHYEIEDELLDPLGRMLAQYPAARVLWCHLAQIRYAARASRYSPDFLADWLDRYPNLYIDTAFGGPNSIYPVSGERHGRFWDRPEAWRDLIVAKPWRFLAALDIGGDRMTRIEEWTRTLRSVLDTLPPETREIVAYKAGWKFLFGEEW